MSKYRIPVNGFCKDIGWLEHKPLTLFPVNTSIALRNQKECLMTPMPLSLSPTGRWTATTVSYIRRNDIGFILERSVTAWTTTVYEVTRTHA